MFCEYSEIFGKPGKGVHKYRFFDIAIVDVILSILLALVIHYFLQVFGVKTNVYSVIIFVFILGIISHRLFCVRTTIDKLLFG